LYTGICCYYHPQPSDLQTVQIGIEALHRHPAVISAMRFT
jgi:hypothetical protein